MITKKIKIGNVWCRVPDCWPDSRTHEAYFCVRFLYECSFPLVWAYEGHTIVMSEGF